jgi:GMP reductase
MRIEEDLKLGFKDVLIRPKRSTLKSRSDVELEREFTFKHSGLTWSGVPIIAANMDTVGTFGMAKALASFGILTAVHKHYTVEQWQAFVQSVSADVLKHVMVSTGTSDADFEKPNRSFLRTRSLALCALMWRMVILSTLFSLSRKRAKPGRRKPLLRVTL